jgi:hypothetical protein
VVDLLKRILVYRPGERPTALECLRSTCFDDLFLPGIVLPDGSPLPPLDRNPPGG